MFGMRERAGRGRKKIKTKIVRKFKEKKKLNFLFLYINFSFSFFPFILHPNNRNCMVICVFLSIFFPSQQTCHKRNN